MENCIEINHKRFKATILKQGAQIISFNPTSKADVFWHTDIRYFEKGKPFRGGIPICWPWFGKVQSPAHGFARITKWELIDRKDNEESVMLRWRLRDSSATRAVWDHPFELNLTMRLGRDIELNLQIDTDAPTTGAFHTYLYTYDTRDIAISGLGETYHDALQGHKLVSERAGAVTIQGEVDRVYTKPEPISTMTENGNRVHLHHANHSDVVLWNPYRDLADMIPDEYKKMVCIETARIHKAFEPKDFMSLKIKT